MGCVANKRRSADSVHYGRFVDDMWWVVDNLESGLAHVALSERKLLREYGYEMHPNKRYQQHWRRGGEFISTWFKDDRTYIGNRVVRHAEAAVRKWNRLASPWMLSRFLCSINSYIGIMRHRHSYRIIRRLAGMVSEEWLRYCHFNDARVCFSANDGWSRNGILTRKYCFKIHINKKHHATRRNQQNRITSA